MLRPIRRSTHAITVGVNDGKIAVAPQAGRSLIDVLISQLRVSGQRACQIRGLPILPCSPPQRFAPLARRCNFCSESGSLTERSVESVVAEIEEALSLQLLARGRARNSITGFTISGSTYATRLSAGGVADEWVTQLLRQGDAKVFKKYSQMKLQMKPRSSREAESQSERQGEFWHRRGRGEGVLAWFWLTVGA